MLMSTIAEPAAKIEFPFPGSEALWQLRPCTIYSRNADGSLVITGEGFRRTVERHELLDPARVKLTPFAQWMQARLERVEPARADLFTSVETLYDDYFDWCQAQDLTAASCDQHLFADKLSNAGIASRTITRRLAFSRKPHHECGFAVSLKAGARA